MPIPPNLPSRIVFTVAAMIVFVFGDYSQAATLFYDLQWNGPETSFVDECLVNGNCYRYPIEGRIGVQLDSDKPYLLNVDSALTAPPGAPANPFAEFAWQRLDWTIGEYLSDPLGNDLSMRFYPNPVLDTVLPLYELFVDLTDGRTMLTLTGGADGLGGEPIETNSVAFSVSGRLVPEPGSLFLATISTVALIANRRRR